MDEQNNGTPNLVENTELPALPATASTTIAEDRTVRGLLDISVELSVPDIFSGDEFTVFVLIKNPFDRPVWVQRVSVSLPDAIRLAAEQGNKIDHSDEQKSWWQFWQTSDATNNSLQAATTQEDTKTEIKKRISDLETQLDSIDEQLSASQEESDDLLSRRRTVRQRLNDAQQELSILNQKSDEQQLQVHVYENAKIDAIQAYVAPRSASQIHVYEEAKIGSIRLSTQQVYTEDATRKVELQSSLPKFTALHPGDTVVFTVKLKPIFRLTFTPAQFRLQFNTLYTFVRITEDVKDHIEPHDQVAYHVNTTAKTISVRAPVSALLIGSVVGAIAGAAVRELIAYQSNGGFGGWIPTLASFAIAMVLGGASVIFTARKSDTQSFVSVEDFWGGALIGFLVGYSGTSFFNQLAGLTESAVATIP
ncbi:MAG: hypothetical protein AAFU54_29975 [Chloroflexota bacterium]